MAVHCSKTRKPMSAVGSIATQHFGFASEMAQKRKCFGADRSTY
jgi:hypothetical protein